MLVIGMTPLWSQPKVPREWDFGVVGGANLSTYNFFPSASQDQSVGYTLGVGARYIEEKFFGIEGELLFTRRGMKDRFDEEYSHLSFERYMYYVEMPVLAHIYFNLGSRSEIAVDLGPKLAYFMGDDKKAQLGEDFDYLCRMSRHGYKHHDMEVSSKLDYGIQAGLGYEFKFSPETSLQLQGRYYFGLGNIFPDSKGNTFEESSNRCIQIVATLWFRHRIRHRQLER